jgi:Ser/Thr protein kinase RdoA (MazF antagonist)
MIHGDPELDNLCWVEDSPASPVWIDLDHYTSGWFAADMCFALRDLAPGAQPPDPEHPLVAAFLRGYDEHRSVSPDEILWWPDFAAAHAVLTVVSISHASGEKDPLWPAWAVALHRRLDNIVQDTEDKLAATFGGR